MQPVSACSPEVVRELRRRIGKDPAFTLYLETAIDAAKRGARNRYARLTGDNGAVLAIAFDELEVYSVLGALDERDLGILCAMGPREVHIAPEQASPLREALSGRRFTEKEAHFFVRTQNVSPPSHPPPARRLGPEDRQQVEAFMRASNADTVFSDWMLAEPFFAVFKEGDIAATAGTLISHRPSRQAHIGNLFTRPELRNRGLARAALSTLMRFLREQGLTALSLVTTADNRPARALVESLGFQSCATSVQFNIAE